MCKQASLAHPRVMSHRTFADSREFVSAQLAGKYTSTAGTQEGVDPAVVERDLAQVERDGYVIIEGRGRVEVGGLAPRDVVAGDVVIIPPLCRQRITNIGRQDLTFLAICTPRFEQRNYEELENP